MRHQSRRWRSGASVRSSWPVSCSACGRSRRSTSGSGGLGLNPFIGRGRALAWGCPGGPFHARRCRVLTFPRSIPACSPAPPCRLQYDKLQGELQQASSQASKLEQENSQLKTRSLPPGADPSLADPVAAQQVTAQMEALLVEKSKLAQENDRLLRENTGLQASGRRSCGSSGGRPACLLLLRGLGAGWGAHWHIALWAACAYLCRSCWSSRWRTSPSWRGMASCLATTTRRVRGMRRRRRRRRVLRAGWRRPQATGRRQQQQGRAAALRQQSALVDDPSILRQTAQSLLPPCWRNGQRCCGATSPPGGGLVPAFYMARDYPSLDPERLVVNCLLRLSGVFYQTAAELCRWRRQAGACCWAASSDVWQRRCGAGGCEYSGLHAPPSARIWRHQWRP